jgi:hypothetical protein
MYGSWGKYYAPLHLNNTSGIPPAGTTQSLTIQNLFSPTTTHISVSSDGNGITFAPKATNFIDVYSGGSPFTLTQELVQRGVEVQDDDLRVVIVGKTIGVCYEVLRYLRLAITSQSYGMPAVLSIKRPTDTSYTEWFVQSANVQEDPTYFGRDIKSPLPTLYVRLKLTRSPYASDEYTSLVVENVTVTNQARFVMAQLKDEAFTLGNLVNADFNFVMPNSTSSLGPVLFNIITDDTFFEQTVTASGTLAAGASATIGTYNYKVQDLDSIGCPLSVVVVADVQSNDIEMRASIQGYTTPYVRSIGTQLSATAGTARVFQIPPIDISGIFSGMPNYDNSFEIPITISIRNINRGSTRTYAFYSVKMFRTMNVVHMIPTQQTLSGSLYPSIQYRVVSFYDNLNLPAQPTPAIKGAIGTSVNSGFSSSGKYVEMRYQYTMAMEVRGTQIRIQKNYSTLYGYIVTMGANCQIQNFADDPFLLAQFRFSQLYQSVK